MRRRLFLAVWSGCLLGVVVACATPRMSAKLEAPAQPHQLHSIMWMTGADKAAAWACFPDPEQADGGLMCMDWTDSFLAGLEVLKARQEEKAKATEQSL